MLEGLLLRLLPVVEADTQQRVDEAWLCWTVRELLLGEFRRLLQFLWHCRHTEMVSTLLLSGLDRTVICWKSDV